MKKFLTAILSAFCLGASAATWYVSPTGNDSNAGTSWSTAKLTIQSAITASSIGDTVLVTNGTYSTGDNLNSYNYLPRCRVVIQKNVLVKSVNGPEVTIIQGPGTDQYANPTTARRCVWLEKGTLSGFTLRDGCTMRTNLVASSEGGGAILYNGGTLTNCVVTANRARTGGGIRMDGTTTICSNRVVNCVVSNNTAEFFAGGCSLVSASGAQNCYNQLINSEISYNTTDSLSTTNYGGGFYILENTPASYKAALINCKIRNNSAKWGGGAYVYSDGTTPFYNCTIVSNSASSGQGGIRGGVTTTTKVYNSIVYGNSAPVSSNFSGCTLYYSCSPDGGTSNGNVTNIPSFADSTLRLNPGSACINAGSTSYTYYNPDIMGNPRIAQGFLDIGAVEFQGVPQTITFNALANLEKGKSFTLSATASSGLPCTYSNSNDSVAIISGVSNVTGVAIGTTTITAYQAGNTNYLPATPVSRTLEVIAPVPMTQYVVFASSSFSVPYGTTNIGFSATATNSSLACVLYSTDTNIARIVGGMISNVNAGVVNIIATNAGNEFWLPVSATQSFTVTKVSLQRNTAAYTRAYGDANSGMNYSWSGFVRGETESVLDSVDPLPYPPIGMFPTSYTPADYSDLVGDNNYNITYHSGTITISKRNISITANPQEKSWGQTLSLGTTAFTLGNFSYLTADRITDVVLTCPQAASNGDVGLWSIIPSSPTGTDFSEDRFNITYINGVLTVRPVTATIDPNGATFIGSQEVNLSASPATAAIYFTTNGTEPTVSSPRFTNGIPVVLSASRTVKAKSYTNNVYAASSTTAVFTEKVATPQFSPEGEVFVGTETVTMTCTTPGATIKYTTDGSSPLTGIVYTNPISFTSTKTVKAIAIKTEAENSDIQTQTYTEGQSIQPPVYNPPTGTSFVGSLSISLSSETEGASIYYTTNGEAPTLSSKLYTSPFSVYTTTVVKAFSYLAPYSSVTNQSTYTEKVATPVLNPANAVFTPPISVTATCATVGSIIRYTVNGTEPSESSEQYTEPIVVSDTTTIIAKGFKANSLASSSVTGTYNNAYVPVVTFNPITGTGFYGSQNIYLTSPMGGVIYYTTDGNDPTTESPVYSSAIVLTETATVKAFAYVAPYSSAISQASYTKLQANEQIITFPAIPTKTYGNMPFNGGATASSGLPCYYTFSDETMAETNASGYIVIKKAGTCIVTAHQDGNGFYDPAATVDQTLTVNKAPLQVTIPSLTRFYGNGNETWQISYSGFVNGDTESDLDTAPVLGALPPPETAVSSYSTPYTAGADGDYTLLYSVGTITINHRPITITANSRTKDAGQILDLGTTEFVVSGLSELVPDTITEVTLSSDGANQDALIGEYPIIPSDPIGSFSESNYEITYVNGTLSVLPTLFVNINRPNDSGDGRSWATAKKTIQGAIDVALNGDAILVTNGTYTGVATAVATSNNKYLQIQSVNGNSVTFIQGSVGISGFREQSANIRVTFTGFTFKDADLGTSLGGGGVFRANLRHCVLSGNKAQYGGGAAYSTLTNCTVVNNGALQGGGVFNCQVVSSVISNNWASSGGGGVQSGSVSDSTIVRNRIETYGTSNPTSASQGAGIDQASAENCMIAYNTTTNTSAKGAGASGSIVNRCWVLYNTAESTSHSGFGGGAFGSTIYNSVLKGNSARFGGGYCGSALNTLINCTVYGNSAYSGGGIFSARMTNSIVGGNSDIGQIVFGEGTTPNYAGTNEIRYCYQIYDPSDTATPSDLPEYSNHIDYVTAPLFVDTTSFKLKPNSFARNSGLNSAIAGSLDLYGNDRIFESRVDMGAVEYAKVANITILPVTGTLGTNYVNVTMSSDTENASIYYTTNGTIPVGIGTGNILYTGAFRNYATNLIARGFKDGYEASDATTNNYSFYYEFVLSVVNGTGSGTYTNRELVEIKANAPVEKQVFYRWTGTVDNVFNVAATNTFILMTRDSAIVASYLGPYVVNVLGGDGSGIYAPGDSVNLVANPPEQGKAFYKWTGDVSRISNVYTSQTSFIVSNNCNIGALFLNLTNELVVVNGSGSGLYPLGSNVAITASTMGSDDYRFYKWTGDTQSIANVYEKSTTVQMLVATTTTATYVYTPYIVVDLNTWQVSRFLESELPACWQTNDVYKTDKLILKKIQPSTSYLGSEITEIGRDSVNEAKRDYLQTNAFYISVFEVTQKQWEKVTGSNPSYFTNVNTYATRPVEQVSYEMLRGSVSFGANWPVNTNVSAFSFIGALRANTGLRFDIPTESQWEFACRGGTWTALNTGKDLSDVRYDENMDAAGRYYPEGASNGYSRAVSTNDGTAKVGSYLPNVYGLYDMHGNAWEWCRDWYSSSRPSGVLTNYEGATSGNYRVLKSGGWGYYAKQCRTAYRSAAPASSINYYDGMGCRLVVEEPSTETPSVTVTVNNGIGSGLYYFGQALKIEANTSEHLIFNHWTYEPQNLNVGCLYSSNVSPVIISVPPENIVFTPVYDVETFLLTYQAQNGTVNGTNEIVQTVAYESDGYPVTAEPYTGYSFTQWNDGVLTPTRTDLSVSSNADYIAYCELNPVVIELNPVTIVNDEGTTNFIAVRLAQSINTNITVMVSKAGSSKVTNTVWSLNFTTNNYNSYQNFETRFVNSTSENTNDSATYTFSARGAVTNIYVQERDLDGVLNVSVWPSNHYGYVAFYPSLPYYRSNDTVMLTAYANSGYRFMGWTSDSNNLVGLSVNPTNVTYAQSMSNETIFALFSSTVITTFITNNSVFAYQTNVYLSTYPALPVPANPVGFNFSGWWTEENGQGTQIQEGDTINIRTNFSVRAYFTPVGQYFLTVDLSDPSQNASMYVAGHKIGNVFNFDEGQTVSELVPVPQRNGWEFRGWSYEPQTNYTEYADFLSKMPGDQTFMNIPTGLSDIVLPAGNTNIYPVWYAIEPYIIIDMSCVQAFTNLPNFGGLASGYLDWEFPITYCDSYWGIPDGITNIKYKTTHLLMRYVDGGNTYYKTQSTNSTVFKTGSLPSERQTAKMTDLQIENEKLINPLHPVKINQNKGYIGVYELTQEQFARIVLANNANLTGGEVEGNPLPSYFDGNINDTTNRIRPVFGFSPTYQPIASGLTKMTKNWWDNNNQSPDIIDYFAKIKKNDGNLLQDDVFPLVFDIPSADVWEYSARGGTGIYGDETNVINRQYSYQNYESITNKYKDEQITDRYLWNNISRLTYAVPAYSENQSIENSRKTIYADAFNVGESATSIENGPLPVGMNRPNEFLLYDMIGNVSEGCRGITWDVGVLTNYSLSIPPPIGMGTTTNLSNYVDIMEGLMTNFIYGLSSTNIVPYQDADLGLFYLKEDIFGDVLVDKYIPPQSFNFKLFEPYSAGTVKGGSWKREAFESRLGAVRTPQQVIEENTPDIGFRLFGGFYNPQETIFSNDLVRVSVINGYGSGLYKTGTIVNIYTDTDYVKWGGFVEWKSTLKSFKDVSHWYNGNVDCSNVTMGAFYVPEYPVTFYARFDAKPYMIANMVATNDTPESNVRFVNALDYEINNEAYSTTSMVFKLVTKEVQLKEEPAIFNDTEVSDNTKLMVGIHSSYISVTNSDTFKINLRYLDGNVIDPAMISEVKWTAQGDGVSIVQEGVNSTDGHYLQFLTLPANVGINRISCNFNYSGYPCSESFLVVIVTPDVVPMGVTVDSAIDAHSFLEIGFELTSAPSPLKKVQVASLDEGIVSVVRSYFDKIIVSSGKAKSTYLGFFASDYSGNGKFTLVNFDVSSPQHQVITYSDLNYISYKEMTKSQWANAFGAYSSYTNGTVYQEHILYPQGSSDLLSPIKGLSLNQIGGKSYYGVSGNYYDINHGLPKLLEVLLNDGEGNFEIPTKEQWTMAFAAETLTNGTFNGFINEVNEYLLNTVVMPDETQEAQTDIPTFYYFSLPGVQNVKYVTENGNVYFYTNDINNKVLIQYQNFSNFQNNVTVRTDFFKNFKENTFVVTDGIQTEIPDSVMETTTPLSGYSLFNQTNGIAYYLDENSDMVFFHPNFELRYVFLTNGVYSFARNDYVSASKIPVVYQGSEGLGAKESYSLYDPIDFHKETYDHTGYFNSRVSKLPYGIDTEIKSFLFHELAKTSITEFVYDKREWYNITNEFLNFSLRTLELNDFAYSADINDWNYYYSNFGIRKFGNFWDFSERAYYRTCGDGGYGTIRYIEDREDTPLNVNQIFNRPSDTNNGIRLVFNIKNTKHYKKVTVIGGFGSGFYRPYDNVKIIFDDSNTKRKFSGWSVLSGGIGEGTFSDANSKMTIYVVSDSDEQLVFPNTKEAIYRFDFLVTTNASPSLKGQINVYENSHAFNEEIRNTINGLTPVSTSKWHKAYYKVGDFTDLIYAKGDEGYEFNRWSDGATNPRCDFVESNAYAYAYFMVRTNTLSYSSNKDYGYLAGNTSQRVPYGNTGTSVSAYPSHLFLSWSDGVATTNRSDLSRTNATWIAQFMDYFVTRYTANGFVSGGTGARTNQVGTYVNVYTYPSNSYYYFSGWSDGLLTTNRTDTFPSLTVTNLIASWKHLGYTNSAIENDVNLMVMTNGNIRPYGTGSYGVQTVPASATSIVSIVQISGGATAIASRRNGSVVSWGNSSGYAPSWVTNVISLSGSKFAYCAGAITNGNKPCVWGFGGGTNIPMSVKTSSVSSLAFGGPGTCGGAITNGAVAVWGTTIYITNIPANVRSIRDGKQLVLGYTYGACLKSNGAVIVWGDAYGEAKTKFPSGLTNVTAIAGGADHIVAITNGVVVAWGLNDYGQSTAPVITNAIFVNAGTANSMAIKADGTAIAWGRNTSGATNIEN